MSLIERYSLGGGKQALFGGQFRLVGAQEWASRLGLAKDGPYGFWLADRKGFKQVFVASQLRGRCPDADVAVSALRPRADGDSLVEDMPVVASPIQELRGVLAVDWEF